MAKSVTRGAISSFLSNPSPDSSKETPDIVVQVVDLKPIGNSTTRFTFLASDGQRKLKAMLPTNFSSEIHAGKFQNLGLIRILDYTCNAIPNQTEKALIITKCEVVSPALETEIVSEVKNESGIILKPKQEVFAKSAAQIVHEQHGNSAPAARMALTRRVHPLVSLNPYQGSWTIKVCLTNKGNLRTYKNAKGEGHVFNVELTDEDGTQIQATMFNNAATKFYPKFELGKMYYISKGSLRVANKQFKTVQNDYEMNLNENSEVEEVVGEGVFVPETKFNFIQIEDLGSYVNGREFVDIIGVLQNVSPTTSIRRKINNETIPKRDITVADDSGKTVVVSLWNDLATTVGQGLLDMVESAPIVAIKSLKVGDFQGVSLSTLSRSTVQINPEIPEAKKLRSWYESEGKGTLMEAVGSGINSVTKSGARSFYSDRVSISHITSSPSLGEEKPAFFSLKAYVSFIKPDQKMWYRACKLCNKKVTEALGSGYWCEGCQKNDAESSLRYILVVKISDPTGEAWVSVFNEQAEKIIGCTADELERMKSETEDGKLFQQKLKEAKWVPHLFRVSVAQHEYNNEKRQRITLRAIGPVDWSAESRYLLEEISKVTIS
ncbi:replication protein A 70 kDa DNA-binding subunit B [Aristolochia californica]|uniref:replication protein A 70 kDa DNA-binding subunit B n=1 Tax=Aristolochia californica TaxID=171875 RepID=UPI0035E11C30